MSPGRWIPIAAIVVGGSAFLSVLTNPSSREPEAEMAETPPIAAQITTAVPAPGSSRDLWVPPAGTWVGGFSFSPTRPDTLYGPSMAAGLLDISPATVVVDSLSDGRLVGVDSEAQQVVLIGSRESGTAREVTPLPWPGSGPGTLPQVSPDGGRLALIDGSGVPYVWDIVLELMASPVISEAAAMEAIASFAWSPDSTSLALNALQGGYYIWNLDTNQVSQSTMPGRAIALSNSRVAAWGVDGLELRDLAGRVLRRWDDLSPRGLSGVSNSSEGAFDPQQRYLAVHGRAGPEEEGRNGLTVLSVIGTTRALLTTDPAQGFAWSGDGDALYWLDSNGLQAWSADPERASATLIGRESDQAYDRLRVYDPAISPVPHPQLATATLLEIQKGSLAHRTREDMYIFIEDSTTVIPAGINGYFLSVAADQDGQRLTLASPSNPLSSHFIGTLSSAQLPEGARLTRSVASGPGNAANLTPSALATTRWFLETDTGSILHGPEVGLFTTVAEGGSLSLLGGTAFHVTPDGSAIRTIPVGVELNTVLTAADLDAERILAAGAIRRMLFVLVSTADGSAQIWQVPADSELLATHLFPPAPDMTSWARIVHTSPGPATGGEILTNPDTGPTGELVAARIDGPNGPVTVVIAASLGRESVCDANPGGTCVLMTTPGGPLGFSPDGNWLVVGVSGVQFAHDMGKGEGYFALSTVGRGSVALADQPPDGVAWVEATGN